MPNFDWTISLGTLLQIAVFAVGLVKIYYALTHRLDTLELKMEPIWKWFMEAVPGGRRWSDLHDGQPSHRRERDEP